MAVTTTRGRSEVLLSRKWNERGTSPERTKLRTEPPNKLRVEKKVAAVVYYISQNGQLQHPHFMEVPLSSPEQGLFLRDVINRLNLLRGKGMAIMYSWSSKRSYKNGFVWHDLTENDFIYPAHGQEYVLKGSELLDGAPPIYISDDLDSNKPQPETQKSTGDCDFPVISRRRNQSWSSIDLQEYKVYTGQSAGRAAADASTQTDDKRRRRRAIREIEEEEEEKSQAICLNSSTELSREEISPPPSDSSPETLETLMKADGRLVLCPEEDRTVGNVSVPAGRLRASSVLMQLISCGSISFRDCGPTNVKEQGISSLISHYSKARLPRGDGSSQVAEENAEKPSFGNGRVKLEDKEYFSGSLIEQQSNKVNTDDFPGLKRSASYNADRRMSHLELVEKEIQGVRAKCIPRKPKAQNSSRNDGKKVVHQS